MTDPQPSDIQQPQQQHHHQQQPDAADADAAAAGTLQPAEDEQQQQLLLQQQLEPHAPPFAPIYTLVNNTSTRTTHHPQVQYVFSDDDPDLLTQALAQQHNGNLSESVEDPTPEHRAILLDLTQDSDGGYMVASASSLSPSWAVLDAQVSRISPPSSDGDGSNPANPGEAAAADVLNKKPERLMLRIEGVESRTLGIDGELRLTNEKGGPGGGSGSGSNSGSGLGSGQKDRDRAENDDYTSLIDEFDKRMGTLRKVVDAGEDRRRKVAAAETAHAEGMMPGFDRDAAHPQPSTEESPEYPDSG
jgi:hypothetical protein